MSTPTRCALSVTLLLLAKPWPAGAQEEAQAQPGADPVLEALVQETLERSPELARAQADVEAERERIPQAGALPDPTLTLGIQNDGFKSIEIGTMGTSYWQVMVTQPLPWPGKRARREDAARAQTSAVEARLERIRLSLTAEVERAYLDLRLARGQLALLGRLESLWKDAEATVQSRYGVGAVPQSDLLRAQLERTRLRQQRIALEVSERTTVQTLNRLRVRALDEAVDATLPLAEAAPPALTAPEVAMADAQERSPDLALSRKSVAAAEEKLTSARQERLPDFTVSAGIMPRGGLEPMWLASVGITLPIFSRRESAVAESEQRRDSESRGEEAVRQVVLLRARERQAALEAALRTLDLYRQGLLVQSGAAVESTLSQYRVGKVPFASVLEAMRGLVVDESGFLQAIADAERVAIAAREVSLEAPPGTGTGGSVTSASVPAGSGGGGGGGGMGGASGGASSGGGAAPAAPAAAGAKQGGGM